MELAHHVSEKTRMRKIQTCNQMPDLAIGFLNMPVPGKISKALTEACRHLKGHHTNDDGLDHPRLCNVVLPPRNLVEEKN